MDEQEGPMTFEDFRKLLSEVLVTGEENLTREASFTTDICVDSIRWVEMALSIEQMGVTMPADAFWQIETVGDAYDYYSQNYVSYLGTGSRASSAARAAAPSVCGCGFEIGGSSSLARPAGSGMVEQSRCPGAAGLGCTGRLRILRLGPRSSNSPLRPPRGTDTRSWPA